MILYINYYVIQGTNGPRGFPGGRGLQGNPVHINLFSTQLIIANDRVGMVLQAHKDHLDKMEHLVEMARLDHLVLMDLQ